MPVRASIRHIPRVALELCARPGGDVKCLIVRFCMKKLRIFRPDTESHGFDVERVIQRFGYVETFLGNCHEQ